MIPLKKNEAYWTDYYQTHEVLPPSPFAVWAKPRIRGCWVWDIGCGDGRDTVYLKACGVDPHAPNSWGRMQVEDLMVFSGGHHDTVYARWFLHAVEEDVEDKLLNWTRGQLLVEARVIGDDVDNTHWRRPIDPDAFLAKLVALNYSVKYFEVDRGFSVVGDDDPLLLRVDAQRAA